ncbi:MAG: T9SS type A sorting domain-containing protein [candidate division Zixibacteria bacterium]|nr:T9SS type A sorting domain-containing protein [candidate division Zixibacteria bacterium]
MVLYPNYPNPFNIETKLEFHLNKSEKVKLEVFNILGQREITLLDTELDAGHHEVTWDASNLPSGIYYYKLSNGEDYLSRKMCLIK